MTNGTDILCFRKGKSKRDYLSFKFEFPGGKIEENETPEEALSRELMEELDIEYPASSMKPFATMEHDYGDFSVRIHYELVRADSFVYTLKEHTEAVWISPDRLRELDWADADREAVELLEVRGFE